MASISHRILTLRDGDVMVDYPEIWIANHDNPPRKGAPCPEVYRLEPHHYSEMTEAWQHFMFDINPGMLPNNFAGLYNNSTAFTNENGFTDNPATSRADYINMETLDRPNPRIATLICGGAALSGMVEGTDLIVNTLNGNQPPPNIKRINPQTTPWFFFRAVIIGDGGGVYEFPYMKGKDVWVPIIARFQVRFPLSKLHKLPADTPIPSPYRQVA